jgi:hypothetical protein
MALSKFRYVGGKDTGVNAEKQVVFYNIVFPLGKDVEVPDDIAHKMRVRTNHPGAEFEESSVGPEKTDAELQREQQAKDAAKSDKAPEKLTPEEIKDLKAKASKEDARLEKVRSDAQLGR